MPRLIWFALVSGAFLGCNCYHLPEWQGTVDVKAFERPSVQSCEGSASEAGLLTPAGKRQVTLEPYLQSTNQTEVTIVWGDRREDSSVVVTSISGEHLETLPSRYVGDSKGRERRMAGGLQNQPGPIAPRDVLLRGVTVGKLDASSVYCYQLVSADGRALSGRTPMVTAAEPGRKKPIRFIALGDSGTGSDAQLAIANRIASEDFDFFIFLGDLAYASGTHAELKRNFFDVYRALLRLVPTFPAIGNHERLTDDGGPFLESFVLPGKENYYSFDWGDVHFVAIDTTTSDEGQLEWLERDLAATKQRWTIVFGHHPPFTNSLRGAQRRVRKDFVQTLSKHDVDLVLSGHEHHYERFRVVGVNFIVSGGGGGRLTRLYGKSLSRKQRSVHHYLAFEVSEQAIVIRVVDINGDLVEKLRLTRSKTGKTDVAVE